MGLIKVLVVEDSDLVAEMLKETLESDRKIRVIGRAANGREALALIPRLNPDLITLDVWMPLMDGFETVEKVMAFHPLPILVITSGNLRENVQLSLRMIAAGALDVIEKPSQEDVTEWKKQRAELVAKVKLLAQVTVVRHLNGLSNLKDPPATLRRQTEPLLPLPKPALKRENTGGRSGLFFPENPQYPVIAIASSTGGPSALLKVLAPLPANYPATILVVQHISSGFTRGLADWLDREIDLKVKIAENGDALTRGTVLLAPDGFNLTLTSIQRVLNTVDPEQYLRPNADMLMKSVARYSRNRAIGIILTGMGADGATGMRAMREAGAYTIAQDEASSLIFGMPRAAIEQGAATEVLPLSAIAPRLIELGGISFPHALDNGLEVRAR